MWPLQCTQGFSKFRRSDLVFEPTWLILKASAILSRHTFRPSFMSVRLKMWPIERTQGKKLMTDDTQQTTDIAGL